MSPAFLLSAALVAATPSAAADEPDRAEELQTKRRTGRVMLGLLPLSFAAFGGIHTFSHGLRHGRIPCATPRNPQVAWGFEAVMCVGLPGKIELVASGAPMTFAAIGASNLTAVRLAEGRKPWRRSSAIGSVLAGSTLIAGGFATVIVSIVAEDPVLRSGSGWGWPFWTHVAVAQSGALLMAAGGALVGSGAAHLQATSPRRRSKVRVSASLGRAPGLVVSGRF